MPRTLKSILRAQGRLRKLSPVAIVDIGSNSVRLVVYEGMSRSPTPLFNEKILCGLGAGLATTGRLDDTAVERTILALKRFRMLAAQAGAEDIYTLATAAARDAKNGAEFITHAEIALGHPIHVLTGPEEAKFAAFGTVCGFQNPKGISADMGGGSVEITAIDGDPLDNGVTLPLGGLRLRDESGGSISKTRELVRSALKTYPELKKAKGEAFYAIGGTWRALGRLHMTRCKYPLEVMHNYEISASEARKICRRLIKSDLDKVRGIKQISSNRRALLPYGAVLLSEIIAVMKPEKIVFSAMGVREGYLYSLLPEKVKKADSLITASEEMAVLRARSPTHARELVTWTKKAFTVLGMKETKEESRLRTSACLLSDVTWRSSVEHRGDQSLNLISYASFVGVDHPGRTYLALSNYYRLEGVINGDRNPAIAELASERTLKQASVLGALFRIAFQFSAAMPGILPGISFADNGDKITLLVPERFADFQGERLNRRIGGLSQVLRKPVDWTIV